MGVRLSRGGALKVECFSYGERKVLWNSPASSKRLSEVLREFVSMNERDLGVISRF